MSLHITFHNLVSTLCELQKAVVNLNTVVASMGVDMKEKYDKYWGECCENEPIALFWSNI